MTEQNLDTTGTDPKVEDAKSYTKEALMKLSKPELIAVAGEIGVDLAVLPKLTKDSISDAVMVFLEPLLDSEAPDDVPADEQVPEETVVAGEEEKPIESIEEELAEPTEPVELEGLVEPEEPTESAEIKAAKEEAASQAAKTPEAEAVPVAEELETAEESVEAEEVKEPSEPQLPVEVMKIVAPELIEEVEVEEPVEPIEPPTDTAIGSYQETLRPTEVEKSVRVRRIEDSNK